MDARPIGIFDSGLGGLSVVKEIIKLLPNEDIVYLGDTARVPYGTRSVEIIKKFSAENVKFLLDRNVKCIVIACNTASAVAGDYLKQRFRKIPVFDVITPVLDDLRGCGVKIGVIGTRATIDSGVYLKFDRVVQRECPLFVPFIEEGEIKGELIDKLAEMYLSNLKVKKLILACTHYPIIENIIQKQVGKGVELVNPGVALAKSLKYYLSKKDLLSKKSGFGKRKYFVTDLNSRFNKTAEIFMGKYMTGRIKKIDLDK